MLEGLKRKWYMRKRETECKNCIKGDCFFNHNKHIQVVEKEVEILDKKISSSIRLLESVYNDEKTLEELKTLYLLSVEENNGKWIVYKKQCYYGGCLYDPKEFDDEYSAYKYSTIYGLLLKIKRREHQMNGATTMIADVNRSCPKYFDCSGMDY